MKFLAIVFSTLMLLTSALAQAPVNSAGPSTDRAISIWDGAAGTTIQNSGMIIAPNGALQTTVDGTPVPVIYFPSGFVESSMFIGNGGAFLSHTMLLEGYYNTCVGQRCLTNITTGSYNTGTGFEVMEDCTSCAYNTAFGEAALIYNITSFGNTAVGWKAALGTPGIGFGNYNTAVGYFAGSSDVTAAPPAQNTAIGAFALSAPALSGANNVADGFDAGGAITSGSNNTLIGSYSGAGITTGSNNVIIGNCPALPPATNNQVMICNGTGAIVFHSP